MKSLKEAESQGLKVCPKCSLQVYTWTLDGIVLWLDHRCCIKGVTQ